MQSIGDIFTRRQYRHSTVTPVSYRGSEAACCFCAQSSSSGTQTADSEQLSHCFELQCIKALGETVKYANHEVLEREGRKEGGMMMVNKCLLPGRNLTLHKQSVGELQDYSTLNLNCPY